MAQQAISEEKWRRTVGFCHPRWASARYSGLCGEKPKIFGNRQTLTADSDTSNSRSITSRMISQLQSPDSKPCPRGRSPPPACRAGASAPG